MLHILQIKTIARLFRRFPARFSGGSAAFRSGSRVYVHPASRSRRPPPLPRFPAFLLLFLLFFAEMPLQPAKQQPRGFSTAREYRIFEESVQKELKCLQVVHHFQRKPENCQILPGQCMRSSLFPNFSESKIIPKNPKAHLLQIQTPQRPKSPFEQTPQAQKTQQKYKFLLLLLLLLDFLLCCCGAGEDRRNPKSWFSGFDH